ncbi:MAG: hypothetical protein WAU68_16510 [Vitreimonas sp.]
MSRRDFENDNHLGWLSTVHPRIVIGYAIVCILAALFVVASATLGG